ncbi:tRNA pseudouridine(38-40) synthase TruA [Acetivibrio straminisolvens]|jgi:tRNA pseudouridine38-40 synthase|uniref:tRNA pseudouridine(38-40) synthase TruA n=1 Tax=Acetivibrio straminisolvens TaxID=253314 RepID=UPI00223EB438|nr:tRNA pseudouridine(38-40) synthase TruA [Acetivibrio straminisolvens]
MRNVKLIIEYDGTNYHGWQKQKNAKTVQDTIESAIKGLTGEKAELTGASRTDFGVHALGQVANFKTDSNIPGDRFSYALNRILPDDIVIIESQEVSPDFHARFKSKGKKYRYLIYNSRFPSAILRNRAFHVSYKLDFESMKKAASYFLGTHDFSSFRASGSSVKTSVRTMTDVLLERDDKIIKFEISGDGFLYNMVRIMVGTLVDVGMGRINDDDIPKIIESKNRKSAGRTAPAEGLYLVEVYY